ncbi:MAG: thiamine phosphate synthase, partial [Lachnospiraceae bacterium]|nr:thiamine phosphate synthase [Lachnospiraceae bacterium]
MDNNLKNKMSLYAITDRAWLGERTLVEQVREALEGGASIIQLREKNLDYDTFLKDALELKKLCHQYNAPLIINDNVEIAKAVDADGVHVGQKDMNPTEVRTILGEDKIIGVSARNVQQAFLAELAGASYLGVGAVFPTGTKDDAKVIDFETLKSISEAVNIPIVAIGGISKDNLRQLKGSQIAGVAVVSAILAQDDIKGAAEELKGL